MKIIKQFGIIFSLCWLATVIEGLLPIAFPASVIAMLLLLVCLLAGVLKIDHIREKSDFLLANMAFFFIPAAKGRRTGKGRVPHERGAGKKDGSVLRPSHLLKVKMKGTTEGII